MDVLTSEICWAVGLPLFKYQDDARSNTHKIHLWLLLMRFPVLFLAMTTNMRNFVVFFSQSKQISRRYRKNTTSFFHTHNFHFINHALIPDRTVCYWQLLSINWKWPWCLWDRASLEQRCKQPTRWDKFRLLIFLNQLYMFRATNSPILRSTFWMYIQLLVKCIAIAAYRCIVPKSVNTELI